MSDDLQSSLENLSLQINSANTRLEEVDQKAGDTARALDQRSDGWLAKARSLTQPSSTLNTRLSTAQLTLETGLNALHTDLDGLDQMVEQRTLAAGKEISSVLQSLNDMNAMLVQVNEALHSQRQATESALQKADQRSREAHLKSRTALETLDRFLQEDYLVKLGNHEAATQTQLDLLHKQVTNSFVPGLTDLVKSMHEKVNAALSDLQGKADALGLKQQQSAEGYTKEVKDLTEGVVAKLGDSADETTGKLKTATTTFVENLATENAAEQKVVERHKTYAHKAEPKGKLQQLQGIPVRLEEVMVQAHVLPKR